MTLEPANHGGRQTEFLLFFTCRQPSLRMRFVGFFKNPPIKRCRVPFDTLFLSLVE